jgi:hypothetical protein
MVSRSLREGQDLGTRKYRIMEERMAMKTSRVETVNVYKGERLVQLN